MLFPLLLKVMCCLDCRISAEFSVRFATNIMKFFYLYCMNKTLLKRWIFCLNEKTLPKRILEYKIHPDLTFDSHWFSIKMWIFFSIFIAVLKFTVLCFTQVCRDKSQWKWLGKNAWKKLKIYFYGNTLNGSIRKINSRSISKDPKLLCWKWH